MCGDCTHADSRQIINGCAKSDGASNRRSTGFKLVRDRIVNRFLECYRQDHVAATLEWLHAFQQFRLAVENADAGRTAEFVSGKSIEIAIEVLYVHRQVRNGLGPIDQYRNTSRMREGNHMVDRIDSPQ